MVLELRHLRHLLALAEHRNFSRAALALHITQSALTRSVQSVEAQIGEALFVRSRSGVEPTEMGRLVLRHARNFDASTRDLSREIGLAKGLELGELRIGVGPYGGSALVGPVVGRLCQLHPRLRVNVVVAPWLELPQRALAREIDLLLIELSEIEQVEAFEVHPLARHPLHLVCRPAHPLAGGKKAPGFEEVMAYPMAGPQLPAKIAQAVVRAAPAAVRAHLKRFGLLTIECDSASVLKRILQESDALSMMPRFMVDPEVQDGRLVELGDLGLGLSARFGAAWLKGRPLSGPERKLVDLLCEHDQALAQRAGLPRQPEPAARPAAKRGRQAAKRSR